MWFSVNVFFEGKCVENSKQESLWEERILLLKADTEAEAERKGKEIGKSGEHEYLVQGGGRVRWIFYRVNKVYPIESEALGDNTELFSRFLRTSEVKSLCTPFED